MTIMRGFLDFFFLLKMTMHEASFPTWNSLTEKELYCWPAGSPQSASAECSWPPQPWQHLSDLHWRLRRPHMPQNTPRPTEVCPLNTRFSYLWRAFSRNLQLSYRYTVNTQTSNAIQKWNYCSTVCGGFLPPVACVPARYCPAGWTVACPVFGWREPVGPSARCCRVLQEPEPDPTHSQFWSRAQMREGGRKMKTECKL